MYKMSEKSENCPSLFPEAQVNIINNKNAKVLEL